MKSVKIPIVTIVVLLMSLVLVSGCENEQKAESLNQQLLSSQQQILKLQETVKTQKVKLADCERTRKGYEQIIVQTLKKLKEDDAGRTKLKEMAEQPPEDTAGQADVPQEQPQKLSDEAVRKKLDRLRQLQRKAAEQMKEKSGSKDETDTAVPK